MMMTSNNFRSVNHLVLNFYPDGYSIAVKLNEFPVFTSETILETAKISYEETSLLDYIENEELPPLLVEMIDGSPKLSQYKIWHNGCLILEVRDKINNTTSTNNHENTHFVLLKPTNLSMLNDVLKLTESSSWSTQDRLQLESKIVLHNSPPLFLEPDLNEHPPQNDKQSESSPFKPGSEDDGKQSSPSSSSDNINDGKWNCFRLSNIYTKHKRKYPYSNPQMHQINNFPYSKCELVYNNYNLKSDCLETNDNRIVSGSGSSSTNGCKINNHYVSKQQHSDSQLTVNLPPELKLQHFLATRRAKKRNFPNGNLARFHRHKKNC